MSDIENRIELIGSENDVKEMFERYSTFHKAKPLKHGENWVYVNENGQYGGLNENTNLFSTDNEKQLEIIPEGFKQEFKKEYWEFPDFNKVLPVPNDILKSVDSKNSLDYFESPIRKWLKENWGSRTSVDYSFKESETVYWFTTYVDSAPGIIEKMSLEFPDVTIIYESINVFDGFEGDKHIFRNGFLCYQDYGFYSKEGYELACKIYPVMREKYVWKDGRYQHKK